jgi:Zn-dependent oligopeptidase
MWSETTIVSPEDSQRIQDFQQRYLHISQMESQDATFRRQLWRWTHHPQFKTLPLAQQDCARGTLSGTLVARWPQYKRQALNQITSEQEALEAQFRSNVQRDQKLFGVYITRLGPLRSFPASLRRAAKDKALHYGWMGWWFEANEDNAAAFKSSFVPSSFKRHMTLERQKVGASGASWQDDNTHVLRRLAALRRHEAQLNGARTYGHYAWSSHVLSTPKQMARFLKREALPLAHRRFTSPPQTIQKQYNALNCSPLLAQRLLSDLWYAWFGLSIAPGPSDQGLPTLLISRHGKLLGTVVLDLHRRSMKPLSGLSGFMLDLQRPYRFSDGRLQKPKALVVMDTSDALWSHRDVLTYFHEMGHVLHLLASPTSFSTSAWDNIEGDAIEWPSMFMETWGWDSRITQALFSTAGQTICTRMAAFEHKHALNVGLQVSWMDLSMHSSQCVRDDRPSVWSARMHQHTHGAEKLLKQEYARWEHLTMMRGTYAGYLWGQKMGHQLHAKLKQASPATWTHFWNTVLAPGGTQYAAASLNNFLSDASS